MPYWELECNKCETSLDLAAVTRPKKLACPSCSSSGMVLLSFHDDDKKSLSSRVRLLEGRIAEIERAFLGIEDGDSSN